MRPPCSLAGQRAGLGLAGWVDRSARLAKEEGAVGQGADQAWPATDRLARELVEAAGWG